VLIHIFTAVSDFEAGSRFRRSWAENQRRNAIENWAARLRYRPLRDSNSRRNSDFLLLKNGFAVQKEPLSRFKQPDKAALQNLGLLNEKSPDTNHKNFALFGRRSNS